LTVRLYDEAGIPSQTLARAEVVVSEGYGSADVDIEWLNCATARACTTPRHPSDVVVRIAKGAAVDPLVCGRALVSEAHSVRLITLFEPCVRNVAKRTFLRARHCTAAWSVESIEGFVLAAVLAHELWHALLSSSHHDRAGLLAAAPDWKEVEPVICAGLTLDRARANELHRIALARSAPVSIRASTC
jgi:hypothetical protein